ncbi:hypothetical protein TB1_021005 [Malus domestica]
MPETLPIPPCRVLIRTPLSDSCFRKYYNKENSGDSSEEVKYLPLPLVPLLVFNLSCYINSKNWLIKKFGDSSDSGDKKRSKLAALRLWYPLLLEALPGYFFLPLDALCPQGIDELKDMRQICGTTTARRDNQKKEGKIDEAEAVGATLGVTKEVLAFIGNISVHPET